MPIDDLVCAVDVIGEDDVVVWVYFKILVRLYLSQVVRIFNSLNYFLLSCVGEKFFEQKDWERDDIKGDDHDENGFDWSFLPSGVHSQPGAD